MNTGNQDVKFKVEICDITIENLSLNEDNQLSFKFDIESNELLAEHEEYNKHLKIFLEVISGALYESINTRNIIDDE